MANQATPEQVAARIAEAAQRAKAEAEARRTQEAKVQLPGAGGAVSNPGSMG